jgi:hypothetical protein
MTCKNVHLPKSEWGRKHVIPTKDKKKGGGGGGVFS